MLLGEIKIKRKLKMSNVASAHHAYAPWHFVDKHMQNHRLSICIQMSYVCLRCGCVCVSVASISVAISGYYNRKWSCSKIHATVKGAKCANKQKEKPTLDSRHFAGWHFNFLFRFPLQYIFFFIFFPLRNTLCIYFPPSRQKSTGVFAIYI